jgi:hypothetical protein
LCEFDKTALQPLRCHWFFAVVAHHRHKMSADPWAYKAFGKAAWKRLRLPVSFVDWRGNPSAR